MSSGLTNPSSHSGFPTSLGDLTDLRRATYRLCALVFLRWAAPCGSGSGPNGDVLQATAALSRAWAESNIGVDFLIRDHLERLESAYERECRTEAHSTGPPVDASPLSNNRRVVDPARLCEAGWVAGNPTDAGGVIRDLEMRYRLAGASLTNPALPPDHIAVELEFMAYLCDKVRHKLETDLPAQSCLNEDARNEASKAELLKSMFEQQKSFLKTHLLNWLPSLCGYLDSVSRGSSAAAAGRLAWIIAMHDIDLFDALEEEPSRQTDPGHNSSGVMKWTTLKWGMIFTSM